VSYRVTFFIDFSRGKKQYKKNIKIVVTMMKTLTNIYFKEVHVFIKK